jgi:hypothetical protein
MTPLPGVKMTLGEFIKLQKQLDDLAARLRKDGDQASVSLIHKARRALERQQAMLDQIKWMVDPG